VKYFRLTIPARWVALLIFLGLFLAYPASSTETDSPHWTEPIHKGSFAGEELTEADFFFPAQGIRVGESKFQKIEDMYRRWFNYRQTTNAFSIHFYGNSRAKTDYGTWLLSVNSLNRNNVITEISISKFTKDPLTDLSIKTNRGISHKNTVEDIFLKYGKPDYLHVTKNFRGKIARIQYRFKNKRAVGKIIFYAQTTGPRLPLKSAGVFSIDVSYKNRFY